MKPGFDALRARCPDTDERLLRAHLDRLDPEYFERFDADEIAQHVLKLATLTPDHPAELIVSAPADGAVECTVLAFDYAFEFSLITGVLSGMGFSIESGDIFTYERAAGPSPARRRPYARPTPPDLTRRRRIIDHFSGRIASAVEFDSWSRQIRERMSSTLSLLENGDAESVRQAKHQVNEWVTERLVEMRKGSLPVLYPVQIRIDTESGRRTRLFVEGQDTPAFLYSLTSALSLHGISIEHVRIRTIHGRIEDEIHFVDLAGEPIRDPRLIDRIKLSALLTKQFTYFLDKAPDPYTALARFEHLIQDISRLPEGGRWLDLLRDPRAMQDLARLLGASDFLWEDFIRLQYESLLPILQPHLAGRRFSEPAETLPARLRAALEGAASFDEQRRRLNEFKDREIFQVDLDHILGPGPDLGAFAERLTALAEHVIREAVALVYAHLAEEHGRPRTVAGLETVFAVLGLGKMGGAALGYASDMELLFVFSDNGATDGAHPLNNDEFFGKLARETAQFIEAKREGIFHVDLRLRPHGNAGPLASSLETFCRYYGPGGPAHAYERLALVRLRAIGGDPDLGARVERLRDEFIYASPQSVDIKAIRELRARQFAEKRQGDAYNAKFSPGALVDIEYTVQMLQVLYAKDAPALRTPRMDQALAALRSAGVLQAGEFARLIEAYDFLRRLINGLRMLRGSAKDLFLPPTDSEEFLHLARRTGYERSGALTPGQQLFVDFETQTAAVRAFVERHFGRESLPASSVGNVADLLLSDLLPDELRRSILVHAGFRNTDRAYTNLRRLAGEGERRDVFVKLAVLACDMLRREPDPDMALNNWEQFAGALPDPADHYRLLFSQPKRLELALAIFSRSQFLANTLIARPELLQWVTAPEQVHRPVRREALEQELRGLASAARDRAEWRRALRRLRRREMLRIGTRDLCLRVDVRDIMLDLSALAEAILQVAAEQAWRDAGPGDTTATRARFCVLAFGKLGGEELNYSSDIDLLAVYDDRRDASESPAEETALFGSVMDRLRGDLAAHTEDGHAFRVDLRLRPYGSAGMLVSSVSGVEAYYREAAAPWEIQALLKLRPVAGSLPVGAALIERLKPILLARRDRATVAETILQMRETAQRQQRRGVLGGLTDVKTGLGGIRDVEFLAQGLQLIHAAEHPELLTPSTLQALDELAEAGILPDNLAIELMNDYIFLRRVEHYLQILEDRQIHALPSDPSELEALSKRMLGVQARADEFIAQLESCQQRVRAAFDSHFIESR